MLLSRTDRIHIAKAANRNPLLSKNERAVLIYLILDRYSEDTGDCYVSDQKMAEHLSITVRAVERARPKLAELGLLTYKPGSRDHRSTSYTFKHQTPDTHVGSHSLSTMKKNEGPTPVSGDTAKNVGSSPDTHVGSKHKTPDTHVGSQNGAQPRAGRLPPQPHTATISADPNTATYMHLIALNGAHGVYADFDSPEWNYWNNFLQKTTGRSAPRDKRGGWRFPTRWPREHQQH